MGEEWKQCQTLFFWAPKSLQMATATMKLKDWEIPQIEEPGELQSMDSQSQTQVSD